MAQIHSLMAALVGAFAASSVAFAQPHADDIIVGVEPDGAGGTRLWTGVSDDHGGGGIEPACVFAAEIPVEAFTTEPGFDSAPGTFPSSAEAGFNIRSALRVWQGGSFNVIPDEWIEITLGPLGPVSTPASDPAAPVPGIASGMTVDGEFHTHFRFTLRAPMGPQGETVPPAAGVYLLELELWIDPALHQPSAPFWIVFDHLAPAGAHDEAVAWVHDVLAWCPDSHHCDADLTEDGMVDVFDLLSYLDAWFVGAATADIDGTSGVDVFDLLVYLDVWFQGC